MNYSSLTCLFSCKCPALFSSGCPPDHFECMLVCVPIKPPIDSCEDCVAIGNDDQDQDGWSDDCDNCPTKHNPNQEDKDGDGFGDACEDVFPPTGNQVLQ